MEQQEIELLRIDIIDCFNYQDLFVRQRTSVASFFFIFK